MHKQLVHISSSKVSMVQEMNTASDDIQKLQVLDNVLNCIINNPV